MGRRATGTVEPRASSIRLKFTHLGQRQVETLDLAPTPANIKAAERLLAKVVAAIDAGIYRRADYFDDTASRPTHQTFREYSAAWLETIVVAKSTLRSYRTALEASWNPTLGDMILQQIKHSDAARALATRSKVVSGKTLNNHLIVLRAVFASAVADELIPEKSNPTAKLKNAKHQAPEADPFDPDEKELILADMKQRYDEQVWNYYDVAFHTGLRPSEQIVVRWPDVDWRRKAVKIHRAQVDGEEKDTKTSTIRQIDLNDRAMAALRRQKAHTFMVDPVGVIFRNPKTGRAWKGEQSQRKRYFQPTLRRLGIRMRDAYQTRHTFATVLLMGGINPAYIAKQLGHATTAMVHKVYAKWIARADKGVEAARANAVIGAQLSPNCPSAKDAI
ncbi:tyrosine-type recombinase/integrase [Caulobacter segnis]